MKRECRERLGAGGALVHGDAGRFPRAVGAVDARQKTLVQRGEDDAGPVVLGERGDEVPQDAFGRDQVRESRSLRPPKA
ncbi:hypothetical protein [Streptomyces sp. NPDC058739]|uniref:hypothetical protein n=1 Tax=Streptomyces sp. NPDC058739 TaxID=3346618 RepID=UPI00369FFF89